MLDINKEIGVMIAQFGVNSHERYSNRIEKSRVNFVL